MNEGHINEDITLCLEREFGILLKRFRQREEEHRKFYEFNNMINWSQIADDIFIHD